MALDIYVHACYASERIIMACKNNCKDGYVAKQPGAMGFSGRTKEPCNDINCHDGQLASAHHR